MQNFPFVILNFETDQAIQDFEIIYYLDFKKYHISFIVEIHGIFQINWYFCVCVLMDSFIILSISLS